MVAGELVERLYWFMLVCETVSCKDRVSLLIIALIYNNWKSKRCCEPRFKYVFDMMRWGADPPSVTRPIVFPGQSILVDQ